ncbi:tropomyosin-1, isoforms 33/34-like [Saccostrea echinata]|uniref:tropomyosin-1, isoforms 33/34-like n=1 Tax=Saccostrea echinata TaxID=191078 RepID=UPI002A80A822|nr:tropomyosin-1, isoforms 33/34-like [Saccostrea echinata]
MAKKSQDGQFPITRPKLPGMEKRSHVEVSTQEQILILRSYSKNRSNWPKIYKEVKTAVQENLPAKVQVLYAEKPYDKIKRRMADQVQKLTHKSGGFIVNEELKSLVMSIKGNDSRYSTKEHPNERKRKFQNTRNVASNRRQDVDGGAPQSSRSAPAATVRATPLGTERPPLRRPAPAAAEGEAPLGSERPPLRRPAPATAGGAAPLGEGRPPLRGPAPATAEGAAPPGAGRWPLGGPAPGTAEGAAPLETGRPPLRGPAPAIAEGAAPPGAGRPPLRGPAPAAAEGAAPPGAGRPPLRGPTPAAAEGAAPPGAGKPPLRGPAPAAVEVDEGEVNRRRAIPLDSDDDSDQEEPPKKKTTSELAREAYEVYLSSAERSRRLERKMEQCMDKFLSM